MGGRERERYSLCCIFLYMCACICIWRPELSFEIIPLELQGLAFYVHSGDMISGPHACVPGTLWTLPTPQTWQPFLWPVTFFFYVNMLFLKNKNSLGYNKLHIHLTTSNKIILVDYIISVVGEWLSSRYYYDEHTQHLISLLMYNLFVLTIYDIKECNLFKIGLLV